MTEQQFLFLLEGFKKQKLSPEELVLFLDATKEPQFESMLGDELVKDIAYYKNALPIDQTQQESIWESLINKRNLSVTQPAHRIHFLKTAWFKYAAAIVLTIGLGTVAYLWTTNKKTDQTLANGDKQSQTDIPPGGNNAVLTLADGKKIVLDDAASGQLAIQGNTQVIKSAEGQITYDLKGNAGKKVLSNTMSTPVGGQYQVTLPDGTRVWLNAASSITFPAAFVDSKREVKINGEVYFEVTKNKRQPFIVDIDGKSTVEVLGTSFNINSYSDEENIRTTLLEGSVKIIKGKKESILQPGYQSIIKTYNELNSDIQIQPANISQALAWKNGVFNFDGLNVREVMRQLERWYDIKVKFEGDATGLTFRGKMFRNVNLSDVLEMFKKMEVKFRMEGKTLIITEN